MQRRNFLKFLGLAPVAVVAGRFGIRGKTKMSRAELESRVARQNNSVYELRDEPLRAVELNAWKSYAYGLYKTDNYATALTTKSRVINNYGRMIAYSVAESSDG